MGKYKTAFEVAEGILKRPRSSAMRKLEKFTKLPKRMGEYANRIKGEWPHTPPEQAAFDSGLSFMKRARQAAGESKARWWRERIEYQGIESGIRPTAAKPEFTSSVMSRKEVPKRPLKITKQQWELLLERVTKREQGVSRPVKGKMTDFVMNQEPPETRLMGRLNEPIIKGGEQIGMQPRDYPFPEAVSKFLKSQREGGNLKPGGYVPPVDMLSSGEGGATYQRMMWKPVQDVAERANKAATTVQKEMPLTQRGSEAVQRAKKSRAMQEAPTEELLKMGMLGDKLWKFIGGNRTLTGKYWKTLMQNARGRHRMSDPRDYFITSFLRWYHGPEEFASKNPQAAKSLDTIWNEFSKEYGDLLK